MKAIDYSKINSLSLELVMALIIPSVFSIGLFNPASGQECSENEAYDPTTGNCDYLFGSCPQGETRGESGFCAPVPLSCPQGMAIGEDPICEPRPITEQPVEVRTIQWTQWTSNFYFIYFILVRKDIKSF